MHDDRIELSIVIPAYREGAKIQADLRAAQGFLARHVAGPGEVIVVDDGSPDDTAGQARAMQAEVRSLRVIRSAANRGKGHALRAGVAATRGRRVLVADAGHCVPFAEALKGLALVEAGVDCAHGSRRMRGALVELPAPRHRRLGSRVFRLLVRAFLGIPRHLTDTQCGFKVYDGDAARRVYGACTTDGFMLDIELIRRARRGGLRIAEFPVRWRCDADTRYAPVRGTLRNLHDLIGIRLRC